MWVAGSVTVADDESVSGSGAALDLYNNIVAVETAYSPLPSVTSPPSEWTGTAAAWAAQAVLFRLKILRSWARQANAFATMVTYATANAVVTTSVAIGGLQNTPNPNNPATPTDPPAAPVDITGVIS